jgi:cardiolipin synthase
VSAVTDVPVKSWRDDVVTVPNVISLARLGCVPVFVWLLIGQDQPIAAAALLAVLGATDWVDGWIARRFDQVSEFGKILDPTADRLMFLVAILTMLVDDRVPVWFAVVTLIREVLISVAALVLGALGARRIDVTWWGKTSTFGLMFAFPLFLVGAADVVWSDLAQTLAWIIGVPSLALHWYAAWGYIPAGLTALREGRDAQS